MTATQPLSAGAAAQVETLRWRDDALEMIDQRLLPLRFDPDRYRTCAGRVLHYSGFGS